ncbi:cyclin Dx, partial [Tachysurus ichikawai]
MSVSLWCEEESESSGTSVRASFDPNASGLRVIERLLHSEERYVPSPLYISLVQREPKRREELAKWTLE